MHKKGPLTFGEMPGRVRHSKIRCVASERFNRHPVTVFDAGRCRSVKNITEASRKLFRRKVREWRHQIVRPRTGSYRCCSSMTRQSFAA